MQATFTDSILKLKQVVEITSLSQATIYRYLNDENSNFPKRVKLGAGRVGWRKSEVLNFINSCAVVASNISSEESI